MRKALGKKGVFFVLLALTSGIFVFTFFQVLRAEVRPLSAVDDSIALGKERLFSQTVSGALQAHQSFLAAKNQYDLTADNQQRIKIRAYLALTRLADVILRNDGQGADTLRKLLAQYGVSFTGDSSEDIETRLPPANAWGDVILPATAPSGGALRAFLAGDFLTAVNSSLADMNLVVSLLGTTESKEIISKSFLDPQGQDPTLQNVEVDDGDYYLLRSVLKCLKGIILTWTAYDQEFDVRELVALVNAEMFNIQSFLNRHPDLLKARSDGPAALAEARQTFIGAIDDYLTASQKIRSDNDHQPGATELFAIDTGELQSESLLRTRLMQIRTSLSDPQQPVVQFVDHSENWTFTVQQDVNTETLYVGFRDDFTSGSYSSGWPTNMTFGYSGDLEYAVIEGTQITLRLASYNGWADFTGDLDNGQINNGTYTGWNWTLGNFSGTFSAVRTSAWDATGKRFNLNPLFGNGSTALNLRDLLPLFSTSGSGFPIAGTMGHGLSNDPTLGGILIDYDSQAIWQENIPLLQPEGIYAIPDKTIAVDGQVGDWDGLAPVLVDVAGETDDPGLDIKALYLSKDDSYLYFRIDLFGIPITYNSPEYLLEFKKLPGDQHNVIGDVRFTIRPEWQLFMMSFMSGAWSPFADFSAGNIAGSGSSIEGRVPLWVAGEIGGRFIEVTARPRSSTYSWLGTDQNRTGIQVTSTASISGTLNIPNYNGMGLIYLQAYQFPWSPIYVYADKSDPSLNPDPRNMLGSQVIFPDQYKAGMTYAIDNLPVEDSVFIFVHWDRDMNGVLSPGDYTKAYLPFTTLAGSNSLNLATADAHSSFPPPEIVSARIFSSKLTNGSTSIFFPVSITGPGPDDVAVTVHGPGGSFTLAPENYHHKRLMTYNVSAKPGFLLAGDYTFEAVDSLGRRAAPVTYHYEYDASLPLVSTTTFAPANRSFVGTTTPTLSWQAPAGGGNYFYQVRIQDWSGLDVWYESEIQAATSITVPPGFLQPDTPYRWYVRLYDSAGQPMNSTKSDNLYFHTGAAQPPAIGSVNLRTTPPAGLQMNYATNIELYDLTGVFPDEVKAIRLKNASGALLRSATPSFIYRFFNSIYYRINYSSPAPPAPGEYTVEVDIKPLGQTAIQTLTATPVSYAYHAVAPVDVTTLSPADNYYFDSPAPTFSWGPVSDPNTYYRLQIRDPLDNIPVWNSAWTKNTRMSVPAGILFPGGSYLWRVWTSSDLDPITGRHNSRAIMNIAGNATSFLFTINTIPMALKGDLNDDGRVDMYDAVLALQVLGGMNPGMLRPDFPASGTDVSNNGKLSAKDIVYILQWVSGVR